MEPDTVREKNMKITINIPDSKKQELLDAFTESFPHGNAQANAEAFLKKKIHDYLKGVYKAHKSKGAETTLSAEVNSFVSDIEVL
jgi:hypothetical protein